MPSTVRNVLSIALVKYSVPPLILQRGVSSTNRAQFLPFGDIVPKKHDQLLRREQPRMGAESVPTPDN